MTFTRVNVILAMSIPLLVVALPPGLPLKSRADGQCNTGSLQCCNQLQSTNDSGLANLLGLLGVVAGPVSALIGINCTPITVIGAGQGANCAQQPVCCSNMLNGLVGLGCIPISL